MGINFLEIGSFKVILRADGTKRMLTESQPFTVNASTAICTFMASRSMLVLAIKVVIHGANG